MTLFNLSPHTIRITSRKGNILTLPPSGRVARIQMKDHTDSHLGPIPLYSCDVGDVKDLPEPNGQDIFIVSSLVAMMLSDRNDLVCPARTFRQPDGQIVCNGLRRFA